jgi:hypothetical protein
MRYLGKIIRWIPGHPSMEGQESGTTDVGSGFRRYSFLKLMYEP